MSLSSWKKEFYRKPADEVSKKDALKHSIKKWTGLLSVNRRKHKVFLFDGCVLYGNDDDDLDINNSSCALCYHYNIDGECRTCPVVVNTGKTCDRAYESMYHNNRVQPMINLLKQALVKKTNK